MHGMLQLVEPLFLGERVAMFPHINARGHGQQDEHEKERHRAALEKIDQRFDGPCRPPDAVGRRRTESRLAPDGLDWPS